MAKIKYLGTADVCVLEKGENFGGRLAEPLPKRVEWNVDSAHLIDSDEAGLSADALTLLLEDRDRFKDVSDMSRIPTSLNEQIFRAMPKGETVEQTEEPRPAEATPDATVEGGQVVDGGQSVTGTAPRAGARSTTGRA